MVPKRKVTNSLTILTTTPFAGVSHVPIGSFWILLFILLSFIQASTYDKLTIIINSFFSRIISVNWLFKLPFEWLIYYMLFHWWKRRIFVIHCDLGLGTNRGQGSSATWYILPYIYIWLFFLKLQGCTILYFCTTFR